VVDELDQLWSIADETLAKACALPWGPERIDALKAAGRLRNEAANKVVETAEFRQLAAESQRRRRTALLLRRGVKPQATAAGRISAPFLSPKDR
jgi:hypothetical protein